MNLLSLKIASVGLLGSLILRLLNKSLRWETVGLSGKNKFWAHEEPRIIAFWHGQQLFIPWLYRNGRRNKDCPSFVALISQHSDGRMMARAMKFLGVDSIAGSSSKGGREALFALIEKLKGGDHIAITPDGPKGPPHKLKNGIIRIAQRSGVPIYPVAIAAERKWNFRSWDKMMLPKPFSRAVLIMGDPISVPSDLNPDEVQKYSLIVEEALNKVSLQAKEYQF